MKPSILFLLHLPPPVHGAAMVGKYIKESKLIHDSFEARFINLSTSSSNKDIGKGGVKKITTLFQSASLLRKVIRSKRFHLVYVTFSTTGLGFFKDLALVSILKKSKLKIIYHFHNKGVRNQQDKWLMNKLYRYAFRNTQSILLSPLLYEDIKKYVSPQDVYYCPNGIPDLISGNVPGRNNKDSTCKLLFLSNMTVEKGVLVLLEACSILNEKGLDFECHFVGDWANISKEEFKVFIEKNGLEDRVFAHGKKYGSEKIDFYLNADIFVFPTFYPKECFPLVLLEAMQFGLPVISTAEGGIPGIVISGETGLLVEKNNSSELADAISVLVKNPNIRKSFGQEGRTRFQNKFTLEVFEENMTAILSAAVSQ